MNAFVLSGGANLGAAQAGMLEGLIMYGIKPDIVVGTSIGSANAALIAADPTLRGTMALSKLWRETRPRDVFPINPLRIARAITRGDSLFSPEQWRKFLEKNIPYSKIEDAAISARIISTRFEDGSPVVFETGSVVDAVMASTALPGVFPPHEINGELYLDGGLADQVPLTPAIEVGACTVYVLSVGFPCPPPSDHRSAKAVLMHSLGILLSQRIRLESNHLPEHHPSLEIVQLPPVCTQISIRDFSLTPELIEVARKQTLKFLESGLSTCCHQTSGKVANIAVETNQLAV